MKTSNIIPDGPRSSWNRFWFQPTDPTTLGFMRIMTGLIVIYVHLAYSFDFQVFFGRDGYFDLQEANRERKNSPVSVYNWLDEERKQTISTPQVQDRRIAVFDFLKHLPENKKERDDALEFLYFILDPSQHGRPFPDDNYRQSLLMLQNVAPLLEEDRANMQAELRKEEYNARKVPLTLPDYFLQMSPDERLRRWNSVVKLMEFLPAPKDNFDYVLGWLEELSTSERKTLVEFFHDLPNGAESKDRIEFIEVWRQDPRFLHAQGRYIFSLWYHVTDPATMWVFHVIFLVLFVFFTIGLWTRVTSILTWLAVLFYIHRTQQVLFGMDTMMNVLLFYLMIGPCGAALSVDRLIARYRASRALLQGGSSASLAWAEGTLAGPRPSAMANLVIRLFQIHFCFIYGASGLAKLKGTSWWNGWASWSTIANPEFCPLQYGMYERMLYQLASFKPLLAVILTATVYFTLILEISLPYLIWTRLRPYLVCGAVFLHTGIAWIMGLTCFGMLMMTLLLCYIPAAVIRERLTWPPGSGTRVSVRFNSRDRRHARAVSLMRALDLTGQLQLHDEAGKNALPDAPVQVINGDGQTYLDYEGFLHALKSLVFGKSIAWLLWVPGVSMLLRSLVSIGAHDQVADKPISPSNLKTPSPR